MIQVTMNFQSVAEAAQFFGQFQQTVYGAVDNFPKLNIQMETEKPVDAAEEAVAKAKRGRKPAAAKPEPEPAPETIAAPAPAEAAAEPVAAEPAPESAAQITIDDVRTALGDYVNRHDFPAGTALVQRFIRADGNPAQRLTEIQPADYAAFVKAAQA